MENNLLKELYYQLKKLSIQTQGPTVLFGKAKNEHQILKVIEFVEVFSVLEDELNARIMSVDDINELTLLFKTARPDEVEKGFSDCLHSFSKANQPQALDYLNVIKRLYDEAQAEFKEKLNDYTLGQTHAS